MVVQYNYDWVGISFYTDHDLTDEMVRLREDLMKLEGIQDVQMYRYQIDCLFAYLFDPQEVRETALNFMKEYFNLLIIPMVDQSARQIVKERVAQEVAPDMYNAAKAAERLGDLLIENLRQKAEEEEDNGDD